MIERADSLAHRVERLARPKDTVTSTAMQRLAESTRPSLPKLGEPGHPANGTTANGPTPNGLMAGTAAAVAGLDRSSSGGPTVSYSAGSSSGGPQTVAEKIWGHSAVTELRMRIRDVAVERGLEHGSAQHSRNTLESVMRSRSQQQQQQQTAGSGQGQTLGNVLGMTVTSYKEGQSSFLAQAAGGGGWRIPTASAEGSGSGGASAGASCV